MAASFREITFDELTAAILSNIETRKKTNDDTVPSGAAPMAHMTGVYDNYEGSGSCNHGRGGRDGARGGREGRGGRTRGGYSRGEP